MARLPNIIPVSDLRQDAAKVLKRIEESREPVVITQRGRAACRRTAAKAVGIRPQTNGPRSPARPVHECCAQPGLPVYSLCDSGSRRQEEVLVGPLS
jgi:antitoxin (DNA-binding transcriptional repressor) of toxin-antitoxin stability system